MDPELKAALEAMAQRLATEIRAGDEETRRYLETRIDAQGRDIRGAMADMEARLKESIEYRREEIDAIGTDVADLRTRVKRLERPRTKPKQ